MAILHIRGVPDDLHGRLRERAIEERRSLSAEVILLLARAIDEETVGDKYPEATFTQRVAALRPRNQVGRPRPADVTPKGQKALLDRIDARREELGRLGNFPDSVLEIRADRARIE